MSHIKKSEWPEIGEFVIATANNITVYGVYVILDEYGKEGFLHVSEISSTWVRNIRNFVHDGEKVVLKVLRVEPGKKHIDLSLRRVTKREKREKLLFWKKGKKAEGLLRSVAQRLGLTLKEVYEKAGVPIENNFGDLYEGLERSAREGEKVLLEIGIQKKLASELTEIAKEKIKTPSVKVRATISMNCFKPNGVEKIKESLIKVKDIAKPRGTAIRIHTISPPQYQIEVLAKNYKEGNIILKKATDTAFRTIISAGGEGNLVGD
jgi:translation initiation factor 2 subunit 1